MKKVLLIMICSLFWQIQVQANPRKNIVLEKWTGTWCSKCPYAAIDAHLLDDSVDNVVILSYHHTDPYEIKDGKDRNERYARKFNGMGLLPASVFNGSVYIAGEAVGEKILFYPSYRKVYDSLIQLSTPLSIELTKTKKEGLKSWTIQAKISLLDRQYKDKDSLMFVSALTENHIQRKWVSQNSIEYAVRAMYPNQLGTPIIWDQNGEFTTTFDINIANDWETIHLSFIGFVQHLSSLEILEAEKFEIIENKEVPKLPGAKAVIAKALTASMSAKIQWKAPDSDQIGEYKLLGYHVYDNKKLLTSNGIIRDTQFITDKQSSGFHNYTVLSVYDILSVPSSDTSRIEIKNLPFPSGLKAEESYNSKAEQKAAIQLDWIPVNLEEAGLDAEHLKTYHIYRNDSLINSFDIKGITFTDTVFQERKYTYLVSAIFENTEENILFETSKTNSASLNISFVGNEPIAPFKQEDHIYPNPLSGEQLYVNSNANQYTVYSLDGKWIKKGRIIEKTIHTNTLESGVYLIELSGKSGISRHKLIIQR